MFLNEELVTQYLTLFRGRGDVYGSDDGGCVKAPLTKEVFLRHLSGEEKIGVYPMVPFGDVHKVVWGCSDFDLGIEKSAESAIKLFDALEAAGITAWIERSRSKGYHVWVFAEEPVSAEIMRNMFLVAHQVAGVPATEVNPKQVTLKSGQYGNYVRLPYADCKNVYTENQRMFYRGTMLAGVYKSPVSLIDFARAAMACRTPIQLLESVAQMYVPPAKPSNAPAVIEYDATLDEAMSVLSPLGKVIWRDGPLPSKDRSSTLAKLGYESVKSGLNPSQTKTVLKTADRRWGKYYMRADGDMEIDKLVVRVHA